MVGQIAVISKYVFTVLNALKITLVAGDAR